MEIINGCLHIYTLTDSPLSKRLLAEYYATLSTENSKKATFYFQESINGYKIILPGTPIEQKRWIEYLIGNQYEYGKGVPRDLVKAKVWYQKAIKDGFPKGKSLMDHLLMALDKVKSKKNPKQEHSNKATNKK